MAKINGMAHIQLTVNDPDRCIPFWERLCHFLEMKTLIKGEGIVYCIGSRTGVLVRGAPPDKRDRPFDQDRPGLHHLCFRARRREVGMNGWHNPASSHHVHGTTSRKMLR